MQEQIPVFQSLVAAKEILKKECQFLKKECASVFNGFEIDQTPAHASKTTYAEMLETLPAEYENEIEIESHVIGIPLLSEITYTYLSNEIQAYHMYEFSSIKIHHLDIFSPPPNC